MGANFINTPMSAEPVELLLFYISMVYIISSYATKVKVLFNDVFYVVSM